MDDRYDGAVMAAREGAEWAWQELYGWLSPRLLGYIRARGAVDPEDVLGEVWVQIARNIATFEGTATGFRAWAFTVAHNRVIDEFRRRKRRLRTSSLDDDHAGVSRLRAPDDAERTVLDRLEVEELAAMTSSLSDIQRSTLLLRVLGDLSVRQTAEALGISESAVKTAQYRAVASMRKIFENDATKPAERTVTGVL